MKEWTEEEIRNKDLMAPCGSWCGVCGIYIATRDRNEEFKEFMGKIYGTRPEETECGGCMQSDPPKKLYSFTDTCKIRNCFKSKGQFCHQCEEWPCSIIENWDFVNAIKNWKRSIPIWRTKIEEYGNEKGNIEWVKAESKRYHCSTCGKPLFRGAQHCRICNKFVADELDGRWKESN